MQCILYARVSTDRQVDRGLSLPAQLAAMRQHAVARRWTILEEFVDEGVSGRSADRPQLQAMLSRCRIEPPIDIVLVHKLDRLARNVYDHAAIRTFLRRHDVQLASVVEQIEDSITGALVEHIMAAIAEFYSANLAQETMKGMKTRIEQGGWPFQAPRGYRNRRTPEGRPIVVVEPREAAAVLRIFELYAEGANSFRAIAIQIAKEGLSCVTPPTHFRRLLENRFYIGLVQWHGVEHHGVHEPLVPLALFHAVARLLEKRRVSYTRHPADDFILRGVAWCADCRKRLTIERQGRFRYYKCWTSHQGSPYFNADHVHRDLRRVYALLGVEGAVDERSVTNQRALARSIFTQVRLRDNRIADYDLSLGDLQHPLLAA